MWDLKVGDKVTTPGGWGRVIGFLQIGGEVKVVVSHKLAAAVGSLQQGLGPVEAYMYPEHQVELR